MEALLGSEETHAPSGGALGFAPEQERVEKLVVMGRAGKNDRQAVCGRWDVPRATRIDRAEEDAGYNAPEVDSEIKDQGWEEGIRHGALAAPSVRPERARTACVSRGSRERMPQCGGCGQQAQLKMEMGMGV